MPLKTESLPLHQTEGAESYMHPDDLMELVYGPIQGNVLWVWDTCFVRHTYFSALCFMSFAALVAYEVNGTIRENVNHVLQIVADKMRGEKAHEADKQANKEYEVAKQENIDKQHKKS